MSSSSGVVVPRTSAAGCVDETMLRADEAQEILPRLAGGEGVDRIGVALYCYICSSMERSPA